MCVGQVLGAMKRLASGEPWVRWQCLSAHGLRLPPPTVHGELVQCAVTTVHGELVQCAVTTMHGELV